MKFREIYKVRREGFVEKCKSNCNSTKILNTQYSIFPIFCHFFKSSFKYFFTTTFDLHGKKLSNTKN